MSMSFRDHPWFQQTALTEWTDEAVTQRMAAEARLAQETGGASRMRKKQGGPTCVVEDATQLEIEKDDAIHAAGGVDAVLRWYKALLIKQGDALPNESEAEMAARRYWQRMDTGVAISPHEAMAEARLLEVRSAAASTNAGAQMHDHAALDSAVATRVAFVDF